jgi:SAM-dependent methyltransferase
MAGRRSIKWKLLPFIHIGFRLIGRRWVDFYSWMLNRQERHNSIAKILRANRGVKGLDRGLYDLSRCDYHLSYMQRRGLQPRSRVLDFGCGFGRSAIPLLRFLEAGNYTGAEISAERIRIAREWVDKEGLADKKPSFIVTKDLELGYLPDGSIDFFWAQAVISHMPEDDIRKLLRALPRVMAPNGVAVFDYVEAPEQYERLTVKDFFYTRTQMESMVRDAGWNFVRHTDWNDDLPAESRNAMAVVLEMVRK